MLVPLEKPSFSVQFSTIDQKAMEIAVAGAIANNINGNRTIWGGGRVFNTLPNDIQDVVKRAAFQIQKDYTQDAKRGDIPDKTNPEEVFRTYFETAIPNAYHDWDYMHDLYAGRSNGKEITADEAKRESQPYIKKYIQAARQAASMLAKFINELNRLNS